MRNWPYAWNLLGSADSAVRGQVGIGALPSGYPGGPRPATLGGWSLAVSTYSKHPKQALALLKHLTGPGEQKRRSLDGSFHPTLVSLYDDKEVLKQNPHLKELKPVFLSAIPRPVAQTGTKYNRLSADFANAVHSSLARKEKPAQSFKKLAERLATYSNNGKW